MTDDGQEGHNTVLTQIVFQPTHGDSILDRIYVSSLQLYSTVRFVLSIIRSDHNAVVVFPEGSQCTQSKSTTQHTFRRKSTAFLKHIVNVYFNNLQPTASSDPSITPEPVLPGMQHNINPQTKNISPQK